MRRYGWLLLVLAAAGLCLVGTDAIAQEVTEVVTAAPDALDSGASVPRGVGRFVGWVLVIIFALLAALFRAAIRQPTTLYYLGGMTAIFAGERLFGTGPAHWPLTGFGVLILGYTLFTRVQSLGTETDASRKEAVRTALIYNAIGTASLLLYLLTTQTVVDAFGLDEDAEARWYGVWTSLFPAVLLLGSLPMIWVDRALAIHPIALPRGGGRRAALLGLSTALGLAVVFPVNYLAVNHKVEYDVAYFKTTEAGTATKALVATLPEPVTAYLFFPAGNDVKEEVLPYFESLAVASGGMLDVEVVDQALRPALAEELKIRDNGYVALVSGEANQKFKLGDDVDKAKRELKKLDSTVQKHLLALSKGKRTVYMLTGHGEASAREKDDPLRKLAIFKKVLQSQSYEVQNFGVTEGSADTVPDDASVVIVAAPTKPLLPEEEKALVEYLARGGSLFVLGEPDGDPMEGLLGGLGLSMGRAPLAHAQTYIRQTRGIGDRVLLVSNRFGSHDSVTTLSKNSTQLAVLVPTVARIDKQSGGSGKVTTLVRSMPDTWEDLDGDRQKGPEEPSKVFDVAVAVDGPEGEGAYRAIVVGDVNLLSDPAVSVMEGNFVFIADAMRWLVGDEDIVGETQSEEDVKIQHTRDEDVLWFWVTIFGVPALVLAFGILFVQFRRRK